MKKNKIIKRKNEIGFSFKELEEYEHSRNRERFYNKIVFGLMIFIIISMLGVFLFKNYSNQYRYYTFSSNNTLNRIYSKQKLTELLAENIVLSLLEVNSFNIKDNFEYLSNNSKIKAKQFLEKTINDGYITETINLGIFRSASIYDRKYVKNPDGTIVHIFKVHWYKDSKNEFSKTNIEIKVEMIKGKIEKKNLTGYYANNIYYKEIKE